MSPRARSWLIAAVAPLLALGTAGWQARVHWEARNPTPVAVSHPGEQVQVEGTTVRLDTFETTDVLPAATPGDPDVHAPDGAVLVRVTFTLEIVDDDVDPTTHYCDITAVDARGRVWEQDGSYGYQVERPAASNCQIPAESEVGPTGPLVVGLVFVVPAEVADEIVVDLALTAYDGAVVRLAR